MSSNKKAREILKQVESEQGRAITLKEALAWADKIMKREFKGK